MEVSDEIIDHVANLARLQFDGEEKVAIREDMNKILTFMNELEQVDTSGVEPLVYMTDEVDYMREDIPGGEVSKTEALKNAPDKNSDFFKVPKVIERAE